MSAEYAGMMFDQSAPPRDPRPYIIQNYEADLNELLALYRAHDHEHPDKDTCGGVGGCLMMRTEVDAEQGLERMLHTIAHEHPRLRIEWDGTDQ